MPYDMTWSSDHPGCVIFLLDQSASMEDPFGGESLARGKRLMDCVAMALNNTIEAIGRESQKGDEYRPRAEIGVIGYGGGGIRSALSEADFPGRELVTITDLMNNPLDINTEIVDEFDVRLGKIVSKEYKVPIWVEPVASGGTPMCAAVKRVIEIAENWIQSHQECFPPMAINITDGEANDDDPRPPAEQFRNLRTDDGEALFFNCHISTDASGDVLYPGTVEEIPSNTYAPMLFEMCSDIPDKMIEYAIKRKIKDSMNTGDKGFVFNADISGVVKMIEIATLTGLGQSTIPESDPDR